MSGVGTCNCTFEVPFQPDPCCTAAGKVDISKETCSASETAWLIHVLTVPANSTEFYVRTFMYRPILTYTYVIYCTISCHYTCAHTMSQIHIHTCTYCTKMHTHTYIYVHRHTHVTYSYIYGNEVKSFHRSRLLTYPLQKKVQSQE